MKRILLTNTDIMKKSFYVVAIASVMVACKHNPQANQVQPVVTNDTTGLAQFQAWKAQNELNATQYTQPQPQVVTTQPSTVTKTKVVRVYEQPRRTSHYYAMNSSSSNAAKVKVVHKKGWSNRAKYGVIGGVTGGVLGAVINKRNRVTGGVIGAVLGGGGGYLLGRHKDKKEGRY